MVNGGPSIPNTITISLTPGNGVVFLSQFPSLFEEASMRTATKCLFVLFALLVLASPVRGSAVIPPRDLGELARMSEAVLLVRAGASVAVAGAGVIYTHTTVEVLDVVSGPMARGGRVIVESYGGAIGVFAGVGGPHYLLYNVAANRQALRSAGGLGISLTNE